MANNTAANRSTRIFVVIMGIVTGLGGILHGLFSALHGNKPTEGYLSESLGGFTVIPNYLYTGIAAMIFGAVILFWVIYRIHKKHGPVIFLVLSIALFLVGGGIAQVLPILITWIVATRLNSPLTWWRKMLSENSRKRLAKAWISLLVTGFALFLAGILVWIVFLPPDAATKQPVMNYLCWAFLGAGLILLVITIIAGFARDIELRREITRNGT